jgi:hypothetical protein
MKIVINTCYGGFGLSHEAIMRYAALKNINLIVEEKDSSFSKYEYYVDQISDDNYWHDGKILDRSNPDLVQVVEELGEAANGWAAELKVVDIPDDVQWYIEEYDGIEWVAEKHRTWK